LVAAALVVLEHDPEAVMAVLPADHLISDIAAFHEVLTTAIAAARSGRIATLGIRPDRPETGYGYILAGAQAAELPGVLDLERFVEKPDAARARSYLADGRYFWNAGIFVARASVIVAEAERLVPDLVKACRKAVARATRPEAGRVELDAEAFAACPAVSFDVAVMEGTDRGALVPADIGWSDVGSWQAVYEARRAEGQGDDDGNVAPSDAVLIDSRNCLVGGDVGPVALIGVNNLAVIRSTDGLLVCDLGRTQEVRAAADVLTRSD
jgi:mannose-1-phosphate guanylyltransferase/mannose-1-phosphate guanylyltransferase/mannose-6-phosphate isomerase